MQFATAAVLCVVVIAASFRLPHWPVSGGTGAGPAPSPWLAGTAAIIAGSVFLVTPQRWAWGAVGVYVLLDLAMIALIVRWSRSTGWSSLHRLALAGGAASAYAWHAFIQTPAVGTGGTVDRIGNVIFAAALDRSSDNRCQAEHCAGVTTVPGNHRCLAAGIGQWFNLASQAVII